MASASEEGSQKMRQPSRVAGIDMDFNAHSSAERRDALVARVDAYAHLQSLHHFHPVAARVLCRQKRDSCAAAGLKLSTVPCHKTFWYVSTITVAA
jgi:hypothetical protein